MKRVRPLPLRTFAPRPSRAPHVSRAPVDGGGRGRYDDAGADLVKPEKHAVGDGNADGDGVGAHRWRQCTGTRAHIFLPHPHPRRLTLWSGALALAFALVPVPVPVLLPRPHPCIHPRPRCVVRNAHASSCTRPRTYPRTRRDGEARVPVRAHSPLAILLRITLVVRTCLPWMCMDTHGPSSWGGVRARACMYVHMGLAPMPSYSRVSSSARGGVSVGTRAGVAVLFLRGYGGRALRRSGYIFGFGCALAHQRGGDGDG
ncbi:hypothetical protein B0H13DRAFT_2579153 [Mycena leptocephala]|nr:hypothetical protein B0H13DRAFT_2579153 [Mycena leptocephala]